MVRGVDEYVGVASEAVTGGGVDDSVSRAVSELAGEVVIPDVVNPELTGRAEVVGGAVVGMGIGFGGGTYSPVQFELSIQTTFTCEMSLM